MAEHAHTVTCGASVKTTVTANMNTVIPIMPSRLLIRGRENSFTFLLLASDQLGAGLGYCGVESMKVHNEVLNAH